MSHTLLSASATYCVSMPERFSSSPGSPYSGKQRRPGRWWAPWRRPGKAVRVYIKQPPDVTLMDQVSSIL